MAANMAGCHLPSKTALHRHPQTERQHGHSRPEEDHLPDGYLAPEAADAGAHQHQSERCGDFEENAFAGIHGSFPSDVFEPFHHAKAGYQTAKQCP